MMKRKLTSLFFSYKTILVIYALFAVIISIQSYFLGLKTFEHSPIAYTHYNNYIIFKQSFFHLLANTDLYLSYPSEHWDLYKYSPTFALLFAPLAYCPDIIGLILWNLLNVIPLLLAIKYLPNLDDKRKIWMLWFILIELTTSLHNHQSNGLMTGLLILSFVFFERKNYLWATFFIAFSVFIKLFGGVAFVFILLYPHKKKSLAYTAFWMLLLWALPLLVTSYQHLISQYESWGRLISDDKPALYALSVLGWLKTWFGLMPSNVIIVLAGVVLFCVPMVRVKLYKNLNFRMLLLSSMLIWVVIFNHKAESPTYVIAIAGVAIWYFYQKPKIENLVLLMLAILLTQLSATDLFPRVVRANYIKPYVLKAVPCIFIWLKILYDMTFMKNQGRLESDPL